MVEEVKSYTFEGKVEISSKEYRDLIEELANEKAENRKSSSDYWRIRSEKDELKSQLDKVTAELEGFKRFIASDIEIRNRFLDFKFELTPVNKEEE